MGVSGYDIAAVKLTVKKVKTEIPEVPELVENEETVVDTVDCFMTGYPDVSITDLSDADRDAGVSNKIPEGQNLFQMKGPIEAVVKADDSELSYAVYSMDSSKGQDGGAVTDAEGKVLAIFSASSAVT